MPLETNTHKLKPKNNNYAYWIWSWHLKEAVKQKVFLEKVKPHNKIKQNNENKRSLWYLSITKKFNSLLNY